MHIGILQTDNVRDPFIAQHGDYPDMFVRLLSAAASDRQALQFSTYDVRLRLPDQIACDAYLITGSRHSVYDPLPWIEPLVSFLRGVLAQDKKVIGICFGHQLMAHFFGGQVSAAEVGWGVGVHTGRVTAQPWMGEAPPAALSLLCSHKDQVTQPPPDADVYLCSEFCPIGGYTQGNQVLTVQGHPEFVKAYSADLMNARRELLGESVYQAGIASLDEVTDEMMMARWILNFCDG